jgi:hypothetical protein
VFNPRPRRRRPDGEQIEMALAEVVQVVDRRTVLVDVVVAKVTVTVPKNRRVSGEFSLFSMEG